MEIRSIPTLALFRGGRERKRVLGAQPAAAIRALVEEALGAA